MGTATTCLIPLLFGTGLKGLQVPVAGSRSALQIRWSPPIANRRWVLPMVTALTWRMPLLPGTAAKALQLFVVKAP